MQSEDNHEKMLAELVVLNAEIKLQNSFKGVFTKGVIYGVGFFVGSVIIASISFSILSPWFGKIDWIRNNFERGIELTK